MSDAEEIRQDKMEGLKKQQEQQQAEAEVEQKLEAMIRQVLTEEARQRLGNVKIANRELYYKTVQTVLYLFKAGQIKGKLGEEELKALLQKLGEKREISIKRK